MKKIINTIVFIFIAGILYSQTFCLRITDVSNDNSNLIVKIEMQGSTGFNLGSSNLQFSYNTSGLGIPTLESSPLAPPFYQVPTVTNPSLGETSLNIELGFENFGSAIESTPNWTELAQINFPILDANNLGSLDWTYNGGTTQTVVFLDDESTQIFVTNISCLESLNLTQLPVELHSFNVRQIKKYAALLTWQTASEFNFSHFDIERSLDSASKWDKIGFVPAQEITERMKYYQFIDDEINTGSYYYRLKMWDIDNTFEYSDIQVLDIISSNKVIIFPNPTKDHFYLDLSAISKGKIEIVISDQLGKIFYLKSLNDGENRILKILLKQYKFKEGMYYISISYRGGKEVFKLLVENGE